MDKNIWKIYEELEKEIISHEKDDEIFEIISSNKKVFDNVKDEFVTAMRSENFTMYYQPHVTDGKCTGAEALFRTVIDDENINPFAEFNIASYYNYEKEFTLDILDRVCEQTNRINENLNGNMRITFNVNPKILDEAYSNEIIERINANGTNHLHIAVEITEVSKNVDLKAIKILKDNNIKVYCDDYGSGYANSKALKYGYDVIKLDKKWITGIDKDLVKQMFVHNTCKKCKNHNIHILAEGVETKQEKDKLMELGVHTIQGYYYSKPLKEADFIAFASKMNNPLEQNTAISQ